MAGPWEKYGKPSGPWQKYAAPPAAPDDPQVGVGQDVAASGAAGLARGAAGLVGLPGTIGDALNLGGQLALRKGYELATGAAPSPEGGMVERFFAGPTPEVDAALIGGGSNPIGGDNLTRVISALSGGATDYQPQTTAGEYARTIGKFLPGAAAFGGASPGNLARMGGVPALLSEGAGQATEGSAAEPYARVVAALIGGGVGGAMAPSKSAALPSAKSIKKSAGYGDQMTDMLRNAVKVAGPEAVARLKEEGLLGPAVPTTGRERTSTG